MGGTFDPIHIGHLVAASEAMYRFQLDRVLFVPTGRPWQKERYSAPEDRYAMTLLGAASSPGFAVSRMEIDRRGPTYTADTMQQLRDFYGPEVGLYFIAGADAILRLHTWRAVERLSETTELIAVTRPGFDLEELEVRPGWPVVHTMRMPGISVSATEIRTRAAEGRPIDFLTPPDVVRFIRENRLYLDGTAGG
jgi:nicotinate-nucleotide adenylyltransferase